MTEEKTGEVIARDEIKEITAAIGSILTPLAQQQGEQARAQIEAETERLRIATSAHLEHAARAFKFGYALLGVATASIGLLLWREQYTLGTNVLFFALGALTGYKSRRDGTHAPSN